MADKLNGRWEERFTSRDSFSGIEVTVTRKGIDVFGFYDSMVGLPGPMLTWAELDAARDRVAKGEL